jgi:hypothetical protein
MQIYQDLETDLFDRSHFLPVYRKVDRLCGLVVRGPGSIPSATKFSE